MIGNGLEDLAGKRNIVLIGMPGAGKSTLGVVLAKELGADFIDADLVIQREEGRLLSRIIEEEGISGFLGIENRICASLKASPGMRAVIATGGSAVYGREGMEHLCSEGWIVYLSVSYENISERLRDIKGRGVVLREGQSLRDLYEERVPLYEHYADLILDESGLDLEGTLEALLRELGKLWTAEGKGEGDL